MFQGFLRMAWHSYLHLLNKTLNSPAQLITAHVGRSIQQVFGREATIHVP